LLSKSFDLVFQPATESNRAQGWILPFFILPPVNHRFVSGPLFAALVLGFAAFPSLGRAQNQQDQQLLIPAPSSEPVPAAVFQSTTPNDLFALSVATDSHTLLIGEPFGDSIKGEVHLYYRGLNGLDEWQEHQVLRAARSEALLLMTAGG
jgi:hypothetical protein